MEMNNALLMLVIEIIKAVAVIIPCLLTIAILLIERKK